MTINDINSGFEFFKNNKKKKDTFIPFGMYV